MDDHIELPPFEDTGIEWRAQQDRWDHSALYNPSNTKHFTTNTIYTPALSHAELNFEKYSMSIMKQMPGQMFPPHYDEYQIFRDNNPGTNIDDVVRHFIFLEDWHHGHYFELDHEPITKWRAGDLMFMNSKTHHCSSNVGSQPKYTLQITGILRKKSNKNHNI